VPSGTRIFGLALAQPERERGHDGGLDEDGHAVEVGARGSEELRRVLDELGPWDHVGGGGWCVVVAVPRVAVSDGGELGAGAGE
jgi:hypothetical protein